MALAPFRMILVVFFSGLCILGIRVSATAVNHCPDRRVAPTPSTSVLNFDHITTVTSIAPLPTNFYYSDYLYLSEFQLLNCSSFAPNSSDAKACSSGNIALLSTGSGSMVFGTPDSDTFSNYRYMNLSSMVSAIWKHKLMYLCCCNLYLHTPMAGSHMHIQPINSRFLEEALCY
ncbi:hypothetical protein POJ06DRAFT_279388 [Lipomyces tetrasporus]|uniref:Uncharacterized protein n=1 Tax=Lipomyces tetrasporus TaxID=54092 RepID=A0AAD7VWL6_9ASCO|nr:uncharacterized protein POJ06DRAFT_279388 [Lipomyces tetrasporus]KAJ8103645.1 hypothetical protein POJ06DRAFT_279388 [Lipomyces tetrasporus]